MSIGAESALDVIWAALEQPEGPTEDQIKRICQLSYNEDSRKEIQIIIDQILNSASSHAPHKMENAFTLMKKCLAGAASEFVTFCIAQLQFMAVRKHEGIGNPTDEQKDGVVQIIEKPSAKPLDPVQLPVLKGEAAKVVIPTTSAPLTPPASPVKQRKIPSTSHPASGPTSPESSTTPQMDSKSVHDSHSPSLDNTPDSVLLIPKEKVAKMTFTSGGEGLKAVLAGVDGLGKYSSPIRGRPGDLLKALESVHHCLSYGSAPFLEHCVRNIWIFSYLGRQPDPVGSIASKIFNILNEKNRPAESKPSSQKNTYSLARSPAHPMTKAVRTPAKSPLALPKPINLEHGKESSRNATTSAPRSGLVPSASLFLLKEEDVAMMSFQSEDGKMAATLMAVNDLKVSESSVRRQSDKLAQALQCVSYCLVWGSAPFVARCREQRTIFSLLRHHSSPEVCHWANEIFDLVKGYPGLHDKATLIPRAAIPPPSFSGSDHENHQHGLIFEAGLDISKCVTRTGTEPFAKGYHTGIWAGVYETTSGKNVVAIKFLLQLSKVPGEVLQRDLNRELPVWRSLVHKNITPFYGLVLESATIGLVSPRYLRGNVMEFVKTNQKFNRSTLLQGIADGVLYLHANRIVHGDIKCANVMVSDDGIPQLIDIGLSQLIDVAATMGYTTPTAAYSLRWSAPELLAGAPKSEKSDVYAFASTYVEMITLRQPYSGLSDALVLQRVKSEGIPPRPTTIHTFSPTDNFWKFLTTCWKMLPQDRPNIVSMRRKLAEI